MSLRLGLSPNRAVVVDIPRHSSSDRLFCPCAEIHRSQGICRTASDSVRVLAIQVLITTDTGLVVIAGHHQSADIDNKT